MRIHFSNVNFSSRSGPNTFAHRLANELALRGHDIVDATGSYDVFLAFIEAASQPNPGSRFVQRLDGIWFSPEQFKTHNRGIKWAYDNAHHVVWQSRFDREMIEHHWGSREGSVIPNGIDLQSPLIELDEQFLELRSKFDFIFTCSANWHPQKRLTDNIRLFQEIRKEHTNSALIVMGSNPQVEPGTDITNVFSIGNVSHDHCLAIYNMSDWMIHLSWLDHCPNVVVEALSQNCPVICASAGGTCELIQDRGVIIEDKPYNFELTDYDNPPGLSFEGFKLPERPEFDTSDLDIKHVADQYEKVLRGT